MIALILFVIVGILFALFATYNTAVVTLSFGQFLQYPTPLYRALLAAFLLGLLLASIFHILKSIRMGFTVRKFKGERKETQNEIAELTKRIHKLELENEHLKTQDGLEDSDTNSI